MTAMVTETGVRGEATARAMAVLEAQARAVLTEAVGRPCVHVTLGDIVVTEWLTAEDASRAAGWFGREMRKATRLSYDPDMGWVVEAAERF
jgi:hypothetical protein